MWERGRVKARTKYRALGGVKWQAIGDVFSWPPARDLARAPLRVSAGKLAVAGLVAGLVVFVLWSCNLPREVIPTDGWNGLAVPAKRWLDSNLHDPGSIEIIEVSPVVASSDGYSQRVKMRAKNSFGAVVLNEMVFLMDAKGRVLSAGTE
jgi:hypothetical protein